MRENHALGTENIGSLLRRFAIPSIIAMLVSSLYNIVDQFFIGRSVGMLGNAATNVAFPLSITCTALSLLCGIGGAANFNLNMGAGKKEEAEKYAGTAITLMAVLGVVLCVTVRFFLDPLMRVFGATSDILDYSLTYTGITSLGFPFLILATGGSSLIRADGSPRFSMFCTLAGAVINTILDPLFIFGFDMGMAGAAWATVIGQVVSGFMVIGYLTRFKTVKLTWKSLGLRPGYCLQVVALGMSPFCNQLAMMVVQIVLNNSLTYYGGLSDYGSEIPLACAGIISKVGMIYFAVVIGIAQGLQPIVSFNYGAKKYDRVKKGIIQGMTMSAIYTVVVSVILYTFGGSILKIFSSDQDVIRFGQEAISIIAPFYLTMTVHQIIMGTLRGARKTVVTMLIGIGNMCILRMLYINFLVPFFPSYHAVVLCYPITWITTMLMDSLYCWKAKWLPKTE